MGETKDDTTGARAGRGLGRREAIQTLLGGVGGGIVVPAVAPTHAVHRHLTNDAALAEAEAAAAASDWKPVFLDAHQSETLASLAERIVPGSTRANVDRFVDRLLSVDTREHVRGFMSALGALEGESIRRFGGTWKTLTEAQQVELLTAASTAEPGRREGVEDPTLTLRDHFDELKGWIVGAYYSSEVGMRELGFSGNVFHAAFPGCQHPGGHR